MAGYGDKWWCTYLDCKNVECKRRLTDKVKEAAQKWWNDYIGLKGQAPIEIVLDKPTCFQGE